MTACSPAMEKSTGLLTSVRVAQSSYFFFLTPIFYPHLVADSSQSARWPDEFSLMYNLHQYLRIAGVLLAFSQQHPLRHSGCI